jgi:hypothetical protein
MMGNISMVLNVARNADGVVTISEANFLGTFNGFPPGSMLTAASVNAGAGGVSGAVVIDLNLAPGQVTFGADGTATLNTTISVPQGVAAQIILNPNAYSFLVVTAPFPSGVLSGQFSAVGVKR